MTYEMIAGTRPDPDEQHRPRTFRRTRDDVLSMMTEISDGTFVAWDICGRCKVHIKACACIDGPVEPGYIADMRAKRFETSFVEREAGEPLSTVLKTKSRQTNAVMRKMLAEGYLILPPNSLDFIAAALVNGTYPVAEEVATAQAQDIINEFSSPSTLDDSSGGIIDPDDPDDTEGNSGDADHQLEAE